MINDKIRNEFLENGVVLLKQIIEPDWILELQKGLEYNFKKRLGLSATPERYNDPDGTKKIMDFLNMDFNSV